MEISDRKAELISDFFSNGLNHLNLGRTEYLIIFSLILILILTSLYVRNHEKIKKAFSFTSRREKLQIFNSRLVEIENKLNQFELRLCRKREDIEAIKNMRLDVQIAEIKVQILSLSEALKTEHKHTNEKLDLIIKGIKK